MGAAAAIVAMQPWQMILNICILALLALIQHADAIGLMANASNASRPNTTQLLGPPDNVGISKIDKGMLKVEGEGGEEAFHPIADMLWFWPAASYQVVAPRALLPKWPGAGKAAKAPEAAPAPATPVAKAGNASNSSNVTARSSHKSE